MSVDTQAYITSDFSPEDVADFIKTLGATEIKVEPVEKIVGYYQIGFEYGEEKRSMSFHSYNVNSEVFQGNLITLGASGCAEYIIEKIVTAFGGMYCKNDCEENWQMFHGFENKSGGIAYFLRWGIINGYVKDDSDFDGLMAAKREWEKMIGRSN
jgi:hypothetical protein